MTPIINRNYDLGLGLHQEPRVASANNLEVLQFPNPSYPFSNGHCTGTTYPACQWLAFQLRTSSVSNSG